MGFQVGCPVLVWHDLSGRSADFWGNRHTGVISVSRFAVRFRPESDFSRPILIGLPFSGFDRSAGGFGSTEVGIFGTTGVISVSRSL